LGHDDGEKPVPAHPATGHPDSGILADMTQDLAAHDDGAGQQCPTPDEPSPASTQPNATDETLPEPIRPTAKAGVPVKLDTVPMQPGRVDELSQPARLGHYQILGELGRGGMGVVHAAYDTKLDRKVAIKLLKRRTDAKARRRFLREAQAMARLSHPNVVQVYDIDESDGMVFIVMEYVRGITLGEWLAQQLRTREEIVALVCAAGAGLAAAHSRGLMHRDFKPANVMINEDGRVLVMDFGLARAWTPDASPTADLRVGGLHDQMTTKGHIVGTPVYMAPEQFEGLETDARADQFSFCVTLWEALYGQRPFKANTMLELAVALKHGTIHMPEDERNVPKHMQAALLRGLRLEPDRRWPSMKELLDALRSEPAADLETRASGTQAARPWLWLVLGFALAGLVGLLVRFVFG
jgi:serine/threonine protein kinase